MQGQKSQDSYGVRIRALGRGLWSGEIDQFDFIADMTSAIQRGFDQAWNDGAILCGISPDLRTNVEQARLDQEVNKEYSFLIPLSQFIISQNKEGGGKWKTIASRLHMWETRYAQIKLIAQTLACADRKHKWILGPTEHCDTCLFYADKVYRLSTWTKWLEPHGLLPQTRGAESGLQCKGYNCQCSLEPTDDPATKGRPPIWIAGKKALSTPVQSTPTVLTLEMLYSNNEQYESLAAVQQLREYQRLEVQTEWSTV